LLVFSGGCGLLLWFDPSFDRKSFGGADRLYPFLKKMLLRFFPWAALLARVCALFQPDLLFAFARKHVVIWLVVMLLYPLLSVYPQEIIFRTFIFHRYNALFPGKLAKIIVSSICFGVAHIFLANWIAPVLSTLGGLLFARTYAETSSTILVSIEHALWGNFIFTIGLGWYFYGGAIA
jgi:hypothetical protein